MNFAAIKAASVLRVSKTALKLKKHAPAIMTYTGVAGMVGTVVLASKATLNLEEHMDALDANLLKIQEIRAAVEDGHEIESADGETVTFDETMASKAKMLCYTKSAFGIAKLYAPATAVGVASLGLILGGHHVNNRRNVALMASYTALDKAFGKYRERVVEALGDDKESELRFPKSVVETVDPETGKVTKSFGDLDLQVSVYAQSFNEENQNWNPDLDQTNYFLKSQQNYANDRLKKRGYLMLNEVHEALGMPFTKAGQLVGWVMGNGDNFVDFFSNTSEARGPLFETENGRTTGIILDFNVDGLVFDLLP